MKAVFVNENKVPYAQLIVSGKKTIETRTKNMLSALVGHRVAIVSTHSGRAPMVVGYADITNYCFCLAMYLDSWRDETLIPKGDTYDNLGKRDGRQGKWFYDLADAEPCKPYPLPANAIRHGRSWCEF